MEESITFKLRTLNNMSYRKLQGELEKKCSVSPLNHVQGNVIHYLYDNRERFVSQKEIESLLGVARSTVANMLSNMEARGLIYRFSHGEDARKRFVSLTEAGISSHENFLICRKQAELEMLEGITPSEKEVLFKLLDKMIENISKTKEI